MGRRVVLTIDGMGSGGAERSLAELLPGLEAAGWAPTVACLYRRGRGVEEELLRSGADLVFLPGSMPAKIRALAALVRSRDPEVVHTTLFQATIATRLALGRRRADGPRLLTSLVNTPYDRSRLDGDPSTRRRAVRVVQAADRLTARRNDRFHAITHAVADAAVRDLGIRRDLITVIERGRDPQRLGVPSAARRSEARRALGVPDDAEVVVNVGRVEFQKGQRDLVQAAATLVARRPKIVVLIAGREGTASAEIDGLRTTLGLGDRVRMLGFRDDLPEVLAAADVFAFPSIYEGLGGALIEAMALGLPIVASDIPAVREVVEPGGNADLVPSGTPSALADAIGSLLDDSTRAATYGRHSRSRFEERFTLEASTRRMLDLYERITDAGGDR